MLSPLSMAETSTVNLVSLVGLHKGEYWNGFHLTNDSLWMCGRVTEMSFKVNFELRGTYSSQTSV